MADCRQIGRLYLKLDFSGKIEDFKLEKFSCSRPENNVSILQYIKGLRAGDILSGKFDDFIPENNKFNGPIRTVMENQFAAAAVALSIYLGKESGSPNSTFAVSSIIQDPDFTSISGFITLPASSNEILGCSTCQGHSGRRKSPN